MPDVLVQQKRSVPLTKQKTRWDRRAIQDVDGGVSRDREAVSRPARVSCAAKWRRLLPLLGDSSLMALRWAAALECSGASSKLNASRMSDNATEASEIESVMIFPCTTEVVFGGVKDAAWLVTGENVVRVLVFEYLAERLGRARAKPKPDCSAPRLASAYRRTDFVPPREQFRFARLSPAPRGSSAARAG
jgi:hypothetical protein